MALRLHEAAHDAEDRIQLLGTFRVQRRGRRRDDGVERPLARRQAVRVVWVQDEIGSPVLQRGRQASRAPFSFT